MHVIFHANGVEQITDAVLDERYTIRRSVQVRTSDGAEVHLHTADDIDPQIRCELDSGALVVKAATGGFTFAPHTWTWVSDYVRPPFDPRRRNGK